MTKTAAADRLEFEGEPISETHIELRGGKVASGPSVLPLDAEVCVVTRAKVIDVSFPVKDGVRARVHKLAMSDPRFIHEDVATDAIIESQERTDGAGTPAMLSDEGEMRRAGRLFRDEAVAQLARASVNDDALELADVVKNAEVTLETLRALDVDTEGIEEWLEKSQNLAVAAGALTVRVLTYLRRRQDEYLADRQRQAAEESARIAQEAREAQAVHSAPDGQREGDEEPVSLEERREAKKVAGAKKAGAKKKAAGSDVDPDGPSTQAQRVALTKNIAALTEANTTEYVRWVEEQEWSLVPAEMTFAQAKASLEKLGDHENAGAV